jgi:hypothetical protein
MEVFCAGFRIDGVAPLYKEHFMRKYWISRVPVAALVIAGSAIAAGFVDHSGKAFRSVGQLADQTNPVQVGGSRGFQEAEQFLQHQSTTTVHGQSHVMAWPSGSILLAADTNDVCTDKKPAPTTPPRPNAIAGVRG